MYNKWDSFREKIPSAYITRNRNVTLALDVWLIKNSAPYNSMTDTPSIRKKQCVADISDF